MSIAELLTKFDDALYTWCLIYMLAGAGIYFTIRTRFVQLRLLKDCFTCMFEKKSSENGISSFQALMIATASRVGTGNMAGVATAIVVGGPGAAFWMWLMAVLGAASAFVESTLAQIYKTREKDGSFKGGPAYYIERALHARWLGIIFAISLIATFAFGFNGLQAYNIVSTMEYYIPNLSSSPVPLVIGCILLVASLYLFFAGSEKIGWLSSVLVPVMSVMYIVMGLLIILLNITEVPAVLGSVMRSAFDFKAIFGGFSGSCMMYGIKRGLYSNEAGCGSAPNAAAAATVSHPVKQGLVQMLSVFIDTLLLCTATALMCLCSGVEPNADLAGAPYVQEALRAALGSIGPIFITVSMILFAFTTLIGNFYYMDNLLIFMHKGIPSEKFMFGFRIVGTIVVFIGAIASMGLLWDLADVLMGVMAIINLPVIVILHKVALGALKDYEAQKAEGKNPVFKAETVGLKGKVDFWN